MSTPEVFALDIGTRKIAGLLMSRDEEGFKIEQACILEQLPGAMADGQIHHIDAVTRIILKIKAQLEQKRGTPLKEAAVAAAGRSLITHTGESSVELTMGQRFCSETIQTLELDAVWNAIEKLSKHGTGSVMDSYLCVGYSVVQYRLDGEPIGSLLNHQGRQASVQVIATFLPRIVIDSLATALENSDLIMESLTLEPIAAMHIVVPPTMRMLNIALVDVGAGTSDLAVSAAGTIKGYGMVSYAGDAITAGIAEHFLLDTKTAEDLKIRLHPEKISECKDVFGNTLFLSYEEVLDVIRPRVQTLADKICTKIVELNGAPPKGVILIGGGSLTPEFASTLAQELNLPPNLVRIRNRSSLDTVEGAPEFSGPQVITPIGIGATYLGGRAMRLIRISINARRLQVLKVGSSTVGDTLLYAGIVPAELSGRPGPAFTVELNGRYIPLPGTLGTPAAVMKNGNEAGISTPLEDGDQITIEPGQPGNPPRITLGEFIDAAAHSFEFMLNGSTLKIEPQVTVNGKLRPMDYVIRDRDKINFNPITNFRQLFEYLEIPVEQEIHFYLNGRSAQAIEQIEIRIEGEPRPLNSPLKNAINVEYSRVGSTLGDICKPREEIEPGIMIRVNGQTLHLTPKTFAPQANGKIVSFDYTVRAQDRIEYTPRPEGFQNSYIVTDIFRDYEPESEFLQSGGRILVNDAEAGFTTPLKEGDQLRLIPYGERPDKG